MRTFDPAPDAEIAAEVPEAEAVDTPAEEPVIEPEPEALPPRTFIPAEGYNTVTFAAGGVDSEIVVPAEGLTIAGDDAQRIAALTEHPFVIEREG
jgi:hypothetical protein